MSLLSKLTGLVINNTNSSMNVLPSSSLVYLLVFYLIFIFVLALAVYIYSALAYSSLAKKTRTEPRWLAWIPIAQFVLIAKMAKMSWTPILFLIPMVLLIPSLFISKILFVIMLIIALLCAIALGVFYFIWHWKIFERVSKPGWWALLGLIPYAGGIIFLVFLGIAAWNDTKYN